MVSDLICSTTRLMIVVTQSELIFHISPIPECFHLKQIFCEKQNFQIFSTFKFHDSVYWLLLLIYFLLLSPVWILHAQQ